MTPAMEAKMTQREDRKSKLHYLVLSIMLAGFCAVVAAAPQADPAPPAHQVQI